MLIPLLLTTVFSVYAYYFPTVYLVCCKLLEKNVCTGGIGLLVLGLVFSAGR